MSILDCTGLDCPMPVIKTKNMLEENESINLNVIVDNEIALENIKKLVSNMNLTCSDKKQDDKFIINIIKEKNTTTSIADDKNAQVIMIKSCHLGSFEDGLGDILMKSFIFSLTQAKPYPSKMIFLNSAVKLTTINEETIKNLQILEQNGTSIVSCGTCLDFYSLKDNLKVGSIGNMYDIVDSLNLTTNKLVI